VRGVVKLIVVALALSACAGDPTPPPPDGDGDLPLGDVDADDLKGDGGWGAALDCKPVPALPPLTNPKITLSIDGLTLHLTDATGFDKVFPVGPGQIEHDTTSAEYGESLSHFPLMTTGRADFEITPATIQPCKTWWTDPVTGAKSPVFAGLPFMSFYGNFAVHGPIDGYRAPNGGSLRRGYVSHGCFRMEAADVLEVYARIKGIAHVPVHLQREPERRADGSRVDLEATWIGAVCTHDADCNFPNGFCAANAYSGRGFCSARCTAYCTDRPGSPSTFCIADPNAAGKGMCVPKVQAQNFECRPYEQLAPATRARWSQPAVTATVCTSGSRGWVGDHCFASSECTNGTTCAGATASTPGICTMSCTRVCPDQPGYADTFCANLMSRPAGGSCVRQCTPSSNASECPSDMTCRTMPRNGQPFVTRAVCMPD